MRHGLRRAALNAIALCSLCWITSNHAQAQSLTQLFGQANAAFFQGDYAQAIERYQSLVDAGVDDADVYYNLGTAYARQGRCGQAILYLERSLKLSAGDDAAEQNLRACQTMLGKRRAQTHGEATVQTRPPWSDAVLRPLSIDALAWLVLVLCSASFGVLMWRRQVRSDTWRLSLSLAASLLGLLLLVATAALSAKAQWLRPGVAAIVLSEEALLREGPDPRAKQRGRVVEGEPARILEREGEFVRVRLARGAEGWLAASDVGAI